MFNSWLFWALAAAFSWGVGQVVAKKSLSQLTPLVYNLVTFPLDILLLLPFAFLFKFDLKLFTLSDFILLAFITTSYTLYYYVISLNKVSLSGTVLSTYPLITMFFAVIFLGEKLSPWQFFWIVILMTGVVLLGLPSRSDRLPESNSSTPGVFKIWFLAAVGMAIFSGFADFLAKGMINRVGVANYLFFYGWAFIPSTLVAFWLDKKGRVWPKLNFSQWLMALLGGALLVLGSGFFFTALSFGKASLVAPVSSIFAVISVILSIIFLRERLTKLQALGVAMSISGIILISAF